MRKFRGFAVNRKQNLEHYLVRCDDLVKYSVFDEGKHHTSANLFRLFLRCVVEAKIILVEGPTVVKGALLNHFPKEDTGALPI